MTLNREEEAVLDHLRDAWNAFTKLPAEHPNALEEFAFGVHRLQDQIASRPTFRALNGSESESEPQHLLSWAWSIIANASRGDWTKETQEWQEAAATWREAYHRFLSPGKEHPERDYRRHLDES